MKINHAAHRRPRHLVAVVVALATFASTATAQPAVSGKLDQVGPFRALRVWGNPSDMGFAHGYLLADDIVEDVSDILRAFHPGDFNRYDLTRDALLKHTKIPRTVADEIRGIHKGIVSAKKGAPELEGLDRPIQVEDLVFYNALDTLRAFGCSGFTVWGERAGDDGVITARTFDFSAFSQRVHADQLIITRQPQGRRSTATIAWPGYLGAFTGFNDAAVAVFLHDGNAPLAPQPHGEHVPVALALLEVLETCGLDSAHSGAREALRSISTPFSYMARIVAPRAGSRETPPVSVFRLDASGFSETKVGADRCITTNHYVGARYKVSKDSKLRYRRVKHITNAEITRETAWAALQAVARSDERSGTLHALLFYPERRRLELAFATWTDSINAAPNVPSTTITLDQLFPPRN